MEITAIDVRDPAVCDAAWRLQRDAYELEATLIGSRGMQALHESPRDLAANTAERFLGCWVHSPAERTLVGVIAVEALPLTGSLISRLAVAPAQHRRGVGRALVRHVVRALGDAGLEVSTGAANGPARRLYESEGFRLVAESVAPDGTALACYRYHGAGCAAGDARTS